jgi:hypothetical protein
MGGVMNEIDKINLIFMMERHKKVEHYASVFLAAQMSNVAFNAINNTKFSNLCEHAMKMGEYFVEISEGIFKEKEEKITGESDEKVS